jgi:hypothetical protein
MALDPNLSWIRFGSCSLYGSSFLIYSKPEEPTSELPYPVGRNCQEGATKGKIYAVKWLRLDGLNTGHSSHAFCLKTIHINFKNKTASNK